LRFLNNLACLRPAADQTFSLIQILNCLRKGDPTPAYSPELVRSAALVDVNRAPHQRTKLPGEPRFQNIKESIWLTQFTTIFHLSVFQGPSHVLRLPAFPMSRPDVSHTLYPSTEEALDLLARKPSVSRMSAHKLRPHSYNALMSDDLPSTFVQSREVAADRTQKCAITGST
jgi:hypothetical protein